MKKIIVTALIGIVMSTILSLPIYAHEHHHHRHINYPNCNVSECYAQGTHIHNGTYYCGHNEYCNNYGHHCH